MYVFWNSQFETYNRTPTAMSPVMPSTSSRLAPPIGTTSRATNHVPSVATQRAERLMHERAIGPARNLGSQAQVKQLLDTIHTARGQPRLDRLETLQIR